MSLLTQTANGAWMSLALLGWLLGPWTASAPAQQEAPVPPQTVPFRVLPPTSSASPDLLDRLGRMEQRLDWVTQQNEALRRENKDLADKVGPPWRTGSPDPQYTTTAPLPARIGAKPPTAGGEGHPRPLDCDP